MSAITEDAASRDPVLALAPTSAAPIATTSQRRASPRSISTALILSAGLILAASVAHSAVKISSAATSDITCSNGVCAPTAKDAVLNAGDLETLLAAGNVDVTTAGSGVQANDIEVDTALTWSTTNSLALYAYESITIDKPVTISGLSGLSIATDDGGSGGIFAFGAKGHVTFANLSSVLTVNGAAYTLEGDIKSLAGAIAANSAGDFALANSYDASGDGTYQNSAIPTEFSGTFEGLGNTISHPSLNGTGGIGDNVGLFAELGSGRNLGGAIENINLQKIRVGGNGFNVGGLVGINAGMISGSNVSGAVESQFNQGGGQSIGMLAGISGGTITRSSAEGTVIGNQQSGIGGLIGSNAGAVTQSYADCKINAGTMSAIGGLAGGSQSPIRQSYALGRITVADGSEAGGLLGINDSTISQSYSTAALNKRRFGGRDSGGLVGVDDSRAGSISSSYWDTTTSKIKRLSRGAGTPKDDPGITGLTSAQLQSGLPSGFDPKVWAEDPKINGGFPYLIANPPRE